jgi:sugar (pentulose or hexulose) kinase
MIRNGANQNCTLVIDVGKTNAKASLWDVAGQLIARSERANALQQDANYRALDIHGIEAWLLQSLSQFSRQATVSQIVTVGHGAAAVLLQGGRLFATPMDYEDEGDAAVRADYASQRDSFAVTGSPLLPCGLNLGMQLHRLETLHGRLPGDVTILLWPQYWAWRLCGVAASEVSSLGCHTDLWQPLAGAFSPLAVRRGWAARMAPLRAARARLGTLSAQVAQQTGLSTQCAVLCGMHDSNAAFLSARAHGEFAGLDTTVLSTGTWFVAMRSLATDQPVEIARLDDSRDCLINVDVSGRPVPSARFMGGREVSLLGDVDSFALTRNYHPEALTARLSALIAAGVCAYPSFVRGVGPFPASIGEWCNKPADPDDQRVIAGLYLALMADTSLDLIGSRERLLVEGRFAQDVIFVRSLAALRPQQRLFLSNAQQDVAHGALWLVSADLPPPCKLESVQPLRLDLTDYAAKWRARALTSRSAA